MHDSVPEVVAYIACGWMLALRAGKTEIMLDVLTLFNVFGFGSFIESNRLAGVPEIMPDIFPLRDCGL